MNKLWKNESCPCFSLNVHLAMMSFAAVDTIHFCKKLSFSQYRSIISQGRPVTTAATNIRKITLILCFFSENGYTMEWMVCGNSGVQRWIVDVLLTHLYSARSMYGKNRKKRIKKSIMDTFN